jgi:adenylylsulfate kinase
MAFVVWMTGLPCSGKTSIIRKLQEVIPNFAVLDGDELREWLSPKDFTKEGRDEHNKKVAHLAKLLLKHKIPVGVSLVSPYIINRENARQIINSEGKFFEVYVKCSLEKCEERDVKGMYKKARAGQIKNFTGLDDPYEIPSNPDLIVDTQTDTIEQSVQTIKNFLKEKNLL